MLNGKLGPGRIQHSTLNIQHSLSKEKGLRRREALSRESLRLAQWSRFTCPPSFEREGGGAEECSRCGGGEDERSVLRGAGCGWALRGALSRGGGGGGGVSP